jgi:hexosaminidase
MYTRMNAVSLDLEWLGLTHRTARQRMLERMAGGTDISSLRVLADVVEPVKDYNRWRDEAGPIDFHAPLTRMIDAVYPESETARHFGELVQTFIQSGYKDRAAESQIRNWLILWRDNDAKLHPVLEQSYLLKADVPLSQSLAMLGAAGLQALDYLDKGQPEPELWKTQQLAVIDQAKKRTDDLFLMVADPVQQLVSASATPTAQN